MKKVNDTRYLFILLSNGDTIYFSVEKEDEIYKIYCEDYVKAFNYSNKEMATSGHSIEFSNNNFILKNNAGMTICSLQENYNKIRNLNPEQETPEITMLYMDGDLRPKLLERGQMLCDETSYNIPGMLYEQLSSTEETSYKRIKQK